MSMTDATANRCPVCGEPYAVRKPPGSQQRSLRGIVACVARDGLYLHEEHKLDDDT